ncbi:MAG: hypothetical protein J5780_00765 [Treponema sp.]|nr:hypothetical protein [Treponema sp.]
MEQKTQELKNVLELQDKKLDELLSAQEKLHDNVRNRKWQGLEEGLSHIRALSDSFVELDEKRESLVKDDRSICFDKEISPVLLKVKSKLSKSRIENIALSTYVKVTQKFIGELIDSVVPAQRNVLYNRNGIVKKSARSSLVVNTVF